MDNNTLEQDSKYQRALSLLDRLFVLKLIPRYDNINFKEIAKSTLLTPTESNDCNSLLWYIEDLSKIKLKYIDTFQQGNHSFAFNRYNLNALGIKVLEAGGHFAYLKKLEIKELADHKRQERKDQADELDLKIKKWQVKTKYLPYIVSIFALTVSIFSYFKPEKKQLDLQQVQQDLQQLKDRVKSQDSLFRVDNLLKKHK